MLRRKAENRPVSKELKQKIAAQRPQAKDRREQPRVQTGKEVSDKEVVVNLKLAIPKVRLPDPRQLYRSHRKHIFMATGTAACLVLVVGAFKVISARQAATEAKKPVSVVDKVQEAFTPLVPLEGVAQVKGETDDSKYRYDEDKKVLGYDSEYNGAVLTISQQALPEKVKTNPGELANIVKSIQADKSLETQKGMAYIATDEEAKTQTAIFATDEVLVFIQANKNLDDEEWKFYINQMNPSRQ